MFALKRVPLRVVIIFLQREKAAKEHARAPQLLLLDDNSGFGLISYSPQSLMGGEAAISRGPS